MANKRHHKSHVSFVRDLGIYVDVDPSVRTRAENGQGDVWPPSGLRQICSIRRLVTRPVLESLVVLFVLSPLDYECATLAGPPSQLLNTPQSARNAAARLIFSGSSRHAVPPLRSHTPRVVYRCLSGLRSARRCSPTVLGPIVKLTNYLNTTVITSQKFSVFKILFQ